MNKPGERAKGKTRGKLRNRLYGDDPKNLPGLRPAKEGNKKIWSTPFAGVLFNFEGAKMESLKINGVEKQFPARQMPSTVAELLVQMDIQESTAAAEVDGQIIERTKFAETKLRNGQSIELVRFVGGG